jgi:hypothetical protein
MIGAMPTGIRAWRERVARAVSDGATLEEVEQSVIEPAPLPPDVRDALWLYAWGLLERENEPALA